MQEISNCFGFKFTVNFREKPTLVFCMASNCTKNSKSKVSTFSFKKDSNENGMANLFIYFYLLFFIGLDETQMLYALEAFSHLCRTLY